MSKINILNNGPLKAEQISTNNLFAKGFEPYSWVFYVKGANRCVGTCFCRTPLKECPVLQYALNGKNLSADLYIQYRDKDEAACGDDVNLFHDFSFTFIPTNNQTGLHQKLTHIYNNCSKIRIPWANTKQPNNIITATINESVQPKR